MNRTVTPAGGIATFPFVRQPAVQLAQRRGREVGEQLREVAVFHRSANRRVQKLCRRLGAVC